MTNDELIYNIIKIKKDYLKYKKELIEKYSELSTATTNEYLNTQSKYKEGDLILTNSNNQNNIYKVIKIKTSLDYIIDMNNFDLFIKETVREEKLFIFYSCQKIQKSGVTGKSYYNIFNDHKDHIKIGESQDYDKPSKIRKLFEMEFNANL
jgi:hypothetical protein